MTTQFETAANIGDVIKAYDFEPRPEIGERYIVGLVLAKGFMPEVGTHGFTVEVKSQSYDNANDGDGIYSIGQKIFVPFKTLFDFPERITAVGGA